MFYEKTACLPEEWCKAPEKMSWIKEAAIIWVWFVSPWKKAKGGVEIAEKSVKSIIDNWEKFFKNTKYTDKVIKQMNEDLYHWFSTAVDKIAKDYWTVTKMLNGDWKTVYKITVEWYINNTKWVFEYIRDEAWNINHRLFKESKK